MSYVAYSYLLLYVLVCVFFFKQKTAYEMRISDWSSDVCSSDLQAPTAGRLEREPEAGGAKRAMLYLTRKIGESVIINDNIEVTVVDIRGKSIKLGFTFPSDATVLRREIFERIQRSEEHTSESSH